MAISWSKTVVGANIGSACWGRTNHKYCMFFRLNALKRSELLANMAHVTVPPCVKWSRRWKWPSTPNTLALSVERLVSYTLAMKPMFRERLISIGCKLNIKHYRVQNRQLSFVWVWHNIPKTCTKCHQTPMQSYPHQNYDKTTQFFLSLDSQYTTIACRIQVHPSIHHPLMVNLL